MQTEARENILLRMQKGNSSAAVNPRLEQSFASVIYKKEALTICKLGRHSSSAEEFISAWRMGQIVMSETGTCRSMQLNQCCLSLFAL
ncbi:hypothetical protein JMV73_23865 [Klebsiella pneumoniae]|nr:hypothetical protein JMV73_23865 [Klebsiella pneumoniae]